MFWPKFLSTSEQNTPFYQRFMVSSLRIIHAVVRDMKNGQLNLHAMSLVYTTMISIVPLLALGFAVLKGFGVHNQLEASLLSFLQPLGDYRFEIVGKLIEFVDNVKIGVLSTAGFIVLLYSAISMVIKIEHSFNHIWHIERGRSTLRRLSDYFSIIVMGPLLIFLSIGLTSAIGQYKVTAYIVSLPMLAMSLHIVGIVVPYLVLASAFALIYRFIPNTRVALSSAFIGGMSTAIVWKAMGFLFVSLIAHTSTKTAIYSAFASAIMLMVWVYWGWLILLIGSSIAFYHQNPHKQPHGIQAQDLSQADQQRLLLNASYCIAKAFSQGKIGLSQQEIAKQLAVPMQLVDWCVACLLQLHFAVQTTDQPARYVPAQPLDRLYVYDIASQLYDKSNVKLDLKNTSVDEYLVQCKQVLQRHLKDINYDALLKCTEKPS